MGGEAPTAAMISARKFAYRGARLVAGPTAAGVCRALVLAICVLMISGCSSSHSDRVVVGSKNFTESLILGELMAQQIEAPTPLKVERRFYLAGTYISHQGILAGRIDMYPEYTGTALTAILKQKPESDRNQIYERVK